MVVGAFAAAALATVLDWVSVAGFSANAWDDGARFRLGDWLNTDNADAYVILLLAAAGAFLSLSPRIVPSFPRIPFGAVGVGAALAAIGGLEWQFIDAKGQGLDPGIGIYVLALAGAAAAVAGYLAERPPAPRR